MALIIKATDSAITTRRVSDDIDFDSFVELVAFWNFGENITINDSVDVFIPETNTRYALVV